MAINLWSFNSNLTYISMCFLWGRILRLKTSFALTWVQELLSVLPTSVLTVKHLIYPMLSYLWFVSFPKKALYKLRSLTKMQVKPSFSVLTLANLCHYCYLYPYANTKVLATFPQILAAHFLFSHFHTPQFLWTGPNYLSMPIQFDLSECQVLLVNLNDHFWLEKVSTLQPFYQLLSHRSAKQKTFINK